MPESTLDHKHASRLAKDTRRELELLLSQQKVLSRRIRCIKRTLNGLCELFSLDAALGCTDPPDLNRALPESTAGKLDPPLRPVSHSTAILSTGRNESVNLKLERACRVALLESEEAASATGIYDRIIRRGSYRLNRYKHPLVHIMNALDCLASRNEIDMVAGEGHPCWVLRPKLSDGGEGYEVTVLTGRSNETKDVSRLTIQETRNTLHDDGLSPSREFEPSSATQVSL